MRLESALFASREGISAHGQAIAIIGDNISNANTVGFRHSRVEFGDLVPEAGNGGESVAFGSSGNGVMVQRVRPTQETGIIESTGRTLDIAIEGRGYLMVGDPTNPYYTRAGNLAVSADGLLVNSNGQNVLGFAGADENSLGTLDISNLNLSGRATTASQLIGNLDGSSPVTIIPTSPASFSEITAAANFVTNLSVYDSLGQEHQPMVAFFKTSAGVWKAQAYLDGGDVGGTAGVPVKVGTEATLTFGTDGKIATAAQAQAVITATPNYGNGSAGGNFTINLAKFTQYAGSTQLASVTQDGQSSGNILDYEIRPNGEFYANLDTGQSLLVGTLRLGDFVNVDGLQRSGNGLYQNTSAAGERRVGTPGSAGLGTLAGASLERSTVDVANQFVDLVLYQRGYQASSQTLNATSQLLQNTISLIR